MKFVGTLRLPRLDLAKYQSLLKEQLMDTIALAATEWLTTAVDAVPEWSGASRATFLPLAREAGYQLTVGPIRNIPSGVPLGLSASTGDLKAGIGAENAKFYFQYSTTLPHLVYNESNDGNISPGPGQFAKLIQPGPYNFQIKGEQAFRRIAESIRLPSPFPFIRTKTVRVR